MPVGLAERVQHRRSLSRPRLGMLDFLGRENEGYSPEKALPGDPLPDRPNIKVCHTSAACLLSHSRGNGWSGTCAPPAAPWSGITR